MKIQIIHRLILFFLVGMLIGCWQKQQHAITKPQTPNYTLSGYLVDMDHNSGKIANGEITMNPVKLQYDVPLKPTSVSTDSAGFFMIDSVIPGNYVIDFSREGYLVSHQKFSMNYEDVSRDYSLPKPLESTDEFSISYLSGNPQIAVHENLTYLFGLYSGGMFPAEYIYTILYHPSSGEFAVTHQWENPFPSASVFFLTDQQSFFGSNDIVRRYDLSKEKLISEMPVEHQFADITLDDSLKNYWSVFQDTLQFRGHDIVTVSRSIIVAGTDLSMITGDAGRFWIYNKVDESVIRIDSTGSMLRTYRPVSPAAPQHWIHVSDITFESGGHRLWLSDASDSGILYRFDGAQ